MEEDKALDLATIFAAVEDPRVERTKQHRLVDIITIAVCGVICGAEGWVEIEEFGKAKAAWFHSWLALPNGIPSHDTFGRVFAVISRKVETTALSTEKWPIRPADKMDNVKPRL